MKYLIFLIPVIGAILGWVANSIAIRIFFRRILPLRQQQIAKQIGQQVQKEFNSFDGIEKKISDPANLDKILPLIENHVDEFLRVKLSKQMPVISMFIGDKTINTLKSVFMDEIKVLFPQVMGQFAGNLKKELDLEQLVTSKLGGIPPSQIEVTARKSHQKEIVAIQAYGAITGFMIGLIQLLITVLTS